MKAKNAEEAQKKRVILFAKKREALVREMKRDVAQLKVIIRKKALAK